MKGMGLGKGKEGVKHASGANKKFFEVIPSGTLENAPLGYRTNITFIITFQFGKKQMFLLESFVD